LRCLAFTFFGSYQRDGYLMLSISAKFWARVQRRGPNAALQKLLTVPKTPLCPCGAFEMDGKILHSAKCAAK
jgi:hypothetical protein